MDGKSKEGATKKKNIGEQLVREEWEQLRNVCFWGWGGKLGVRQKSRGSGGVGPAWDGIRFRGVTKDLVPAEEKGKRLPVQSPRR